MIKATICMRRLKTKLQIFFLHFQQQKRRTEKEEKEKKKKKTKRQMHF